MPTTTRLPVVPATARGDGRRTAAYWAFAAVIGLVILYPLAWLMVGVVQDAPDVLAYLLDARTLKITFRTVTLGLATAVAACAIGTGLAFLVHRTDMPGRRIVVGLVVASYMTPSFVLAFGYVMLFGPNAGWLNRAAEWLLGIPVLYDVFSNSGFVLLCTFETMPVAFLAVSAVLVSTHGSLEQAGRILGASRWRLVRTVVLPLARPAIAASALLVFILAISLFGVPAVLGVTVITTEIVSSLSFPLRLERAAGLSILMSLLALAAVYGFRRSTRGAQRFATITGQWMAPERMVLGRWRHLALAAALGYLAFATLVPYAVLLHASLSRTWSAGVSAGNFTLENYTSVLSNPFVQGAIVNSLKLAVWAASLAVLVGYVIAFIEERGEAVRGKGVLEYVAMVPWGIPSVAIAAGLILAFTRPPVVLWGTITILLLAYFIKFLPLAVRSLRSAVAQVSPELERAARIFGASPLRTTLTITVPLVARGAVVAWLLVFFPSLRELSASIILFGTHTQTLAVATLLNWQSADFEGTTALAMVTLVMSFLPFGLAALLLRRWGLARVGERRIQAGVTGLP